MHPLDIPTGDLGSHDEEIDIVETERVLQILQSFLQEQRKPAREQDVIQYYRLFQYRFGRPITYTNLQKFLDDEEQSFALEHYRPDRVDRILNPVRETFLRLFGARRQDK